MARLSRQSILRVTASLIAAERTNHGAGRPWDCAGWTEATSFGGDGLALDSLEYWACANEASRFFRLHETGAERRLIDAGTLGLWCDIIEAAPAQAAPGVTFATSGTTGLPKLCRQSLDALYGEAAYWRGRLDGCARVVHTVAAHHIYGFLFAVLLPEITAWPVVDARMWPPGALRAMLRPTDLLVGFPAQLALLLRGTNDLPRSLRVASATSRLDEATHAGLYVRGAGEVIDIYGSTETGGIGQRSEPGAAFALLPRWTRPACGAALTDIATGEKYRLPDIVVWEDERRLRPVDRADGAVQVAGVNVYPGRVAAILRGHAMVADCAVWLDATMAEPRLKAFVVPGAGYGEGEVVASCDAWARRHFTAPERPVDFAVVAALPPPRG
jgi:long-chain acyl-CoA synthetase